jgi:non-specific serine/threonine protein kinase
MGKTRLALAVAEAVLDDFADRVWLAELASVVDPQLIPTAVGRIFGVQGDVEPAVLETLADVLRNRSLLLVLDNCEHVVEACAELFTHLLQACPQVRVLATSREPLGVEGEQVWQVPSLTMPERCVDVRAAEHLDAFEAVRLFVERARAARPDFSLTNGNAPAVVSLCQRLDGLPLAIELAAAQVRGLAPEQLLERLDRRFRRLPGTIRTAPPRHQTLQAAIDWSYDLLTPAEQALFSRLAVFAGGWTADAAEAVVAGAGLREDEVLPNLLRLADKSLVIADWTEGGRARYRFLETMRQDAVERLAVRVEAERMHKRHAAYFLPLAEQADREWAAPGDAASMDDLEIEHDNVRAALGWLIESGDVDSAWRLGSAVWHIWLHRGHVLEARAWLDRCLSLPGDQHSRQLLKLLLGAGVTAHRQGDLVTAEALGQDGLKLAVDRGDNTAASYALLLLGITATARGEYLAARALHQRGVLVAQAASRESSDEIQTYAARLAGHWELQNLWGLASAAALQGAYAEARVHAEDARRRATEGGYARPLAHALRVLGLVSYRQGEYDAARSLLFQSLEAWGSLGERSVVEIEVLVVLGCVARDQGELVLSRQLLGDSLAMTERVGGILRTPRCLDAFAGLAAASGQPERAIRLEAAAAALYESLGCDPRRQYRFELDNWLLPARSVLSASRTSQEEATGRALTRTEAIAEAQAIQPTGVAGRQPR